MTRSATPADLEHFRAVVAERLGLDYDTDRLECLADVLQQRVHATGAEHAAAYVERLAAAPGASLELRELAERLTVNETFFFRNADNFRALIGHVLPELVERRRSQRRLRILSAGCATGEEPYSLAIAVREVLPDLASWDVGILGVDLAHLALAKAARARYSAWSLRATSPEVRSRYFRIEGKEYVLDRAVTQMVAFQERNLIEADPEFWRESSFDVVFCRNLLMYLTPSRMRELVGRLGACLVPEGYLFLGHAETLRGLTQAFHLCHTHATFYYQKRDGWGVSSRERQLSVGDARAEDRSEPSWNDLSPEGSWVDTIKRSSDRIAELSSSPGVSTAAPAQGEPPETLVAWDLALVLDAMRHERFADALNLLTALPPASRQKPDTLLLYAALLVNNARLVEAEAACAQLLQLDPRSAGAHYVMALCREHAADAAGAAEHDQAAIQLDPFFAMPHLHLGLMARRAGDDDTARAELSKSLELLAREDATRVLLFGGGFARESLLELCRSELIAAGGAP